jgi:hypothetical protein
MIAKDKSFNIINDKFRNSLNISVKNYDASPKIEDFNE